MNSSYWPLNSNIDQCIRTEAEELSEQVLLAVHEPMQLEQRLPGQSYGEKADESKLLKHLIETERPIPIIGESGVGKSHIIRWLDAQLKLQNNEHWHIIRIPKNASLRKVLISLLDGLEGDIFETARAKVNEVGVRLNTQDLADHLVVFIGHRLAELHEETKKELENIRHSGQQPDIETRNRIDRIKRHAKRTGLPALLGDSNYKELLVGENKCLYQIAKRLISGSTEKEIEDNNYQIHVNDLDFSLNTDNLSSIARQYIRDASLNTDESRRQEATDLLNLVLSDACGSAFSQLFQFHGGSFQDLFVEIRKYLFDRGKTLFILVEDMAAISAIEDILIDSLMQEGMRDGKQELCSLHSAIAVTDGYPGYTRRRNTLATRAKTEWFINKYLDSEEDTYQRIESFCGRYLNASRFGENALQKLSWSTKEFHIWESDDLEERQRVECFGRSKEGFPLFPYNKQALRRLVDKHCRSNQNEIEFKPRTILGKILLDFVPNFRSTYSEGKFPPAGLGSFDCSTVIASQLSHQITLELERIKTFVAIWGYGAEDLNELPIILSPEIAKEFSLDEFSEILKLIVPSKTKKFAIPLVRPVVGKTEESKVGDSPEVLINDKINKSKQIAKDLDIWFDTKNIPQEEANILRKVLFKEFSNFKIANKLGFYGVKGLPELKQGKITLIYIPYNKNNPAKNYLSFGSDIIFDNEVKSLPYREFILAVLRRNLYVGPDSDSWVFQNGYEDYCTYINFVSAWLPPQIQKFINSERTKTKIILESHLGLASVFDPIITTRSSDEKINMLVRPSNSERDGLGRSLEDNFPNTGIDVWDAHLKDLRILWSKEQAQWLDLYSINRHALEADLIKRELRGVVSKVPTETKKCAQSLSRSLCDDYQVVELLESCTTEELFQETLERLRFVVSELSTSGQFLSADNSFTPKKYLNLIKKISEHKPYWRTCKSLLQLRTGFNDSAIKYLNEIDLVLAEELKECLRRWNDFCEFNIERMKYENSKNGADSRSENRLLITKYINDTQIQLLTLLEVE
jgi:predicted ATPase